MPPEEQEAQPVAENVPAPDPDGTTEQQATGDDGSASGDANQGSADSDKAKWASDRAGLERQMRDQTTVAKEQQLRIDELTSKLDEWKDPIEKLMSGDSPLNSYKQFTQRIANDGPEELSENEQLRADLDALRNERKDEKDAHAQGVATQALTDAAARDKEFVDASESHLFTKTLGMSHNLARLRGEMHEAGQRDIQLSEVADKLESRVVESVSKQMDDLLTVPAFQDMLREKLNKTTQPARQASEGTKQEEGEAKPSLSTLSNSLNGTEVKDIDWNSMEKDESLAKSRDLFFKELDRQDLASS